MKKYKKLSVRMTLYCLLFAGLLSAFIGGLGFYTYKINSVGHYEKYIRTILALALNDIDENALQNNIRYEKTDGSHGELQSHINDIKQNSDIEYIYIVNRDENDYRYVLCGYGKEELEGGEELKKFGDIVTESDIAPDMLLHFDNILEGNAKEIYLPNTSDLGYVMTGAVPVRLESGEIIAVLGVDIPMSDIQKDLKTYVYSVLIGACTIAGLFFLFFLTLIRKKIVDPILALGRHTDAFVRLTEGSPSEMKVNELNIRTQDEIERFAGQLNRMMKDMVVYMSDLESAAAARERLGVQMNVAGQIQQGMMPGIFPAFPERMEFDIYAVMKPAGDVGGEFYDFFMIDGIRLGIVVADVSGEGIPAALFMMQTRTLIKNYAMLGMEPAKVLYEVNRELSKGNDAGMTVSALVGLLDVYYGDFLYASAGENTPLINREGNDWEDMETTPGFLMGMLEKIPYQQRHHKLQKGDVLVLHTGGINNLEKEDGEKFQCKEALQGSLGEEVTLKGLLDGVIHTADAFMDGRERCEDMTFLAVEYRGLAIEAG